MNILFYTYYKPVPTNGGIERVTSVIASGLSHEKKHNCYSLYEKTVEGEFNNAFSLSGELPIGNRANYLKSYINNHDIKCVVVQGRFDILPLFSSICRQCNVKLVYVLHSDPGYGYNTFNVSTLLHEIRGSKGMLKIHKLFILLLYPFYKLKCKYVVKANLKYAYSLVDRFVMISENAVSYFSKLSGIDMPSKMLVINNPLSYNQCIDEDYYSQKEKRVLIVSRMEEHSKKISYAIKAWKRIELKREAEDWQLDIVGDGADMDMYKAMVKRYNLKRIHFHGSKNPLDFYKRSSIFLMSSCSEAWGMTITEAQQNMCVPVAFDSYCAIRDIINKKNGILVKYPDLNKYSESVFLLMTNNKLRKDMAFEGLETVQRFTILNVVEKWNMLFENI